jgi:hypothetical protein
MTSQLITASLIALVFFLFVVLSQGRKPYKKEEAEMLIDDLYKALSRKDILTRITKAPEEERSRLKTIIDLQDPLADGIGYEIIQADLPVIHQVSVDALAANVTQNPQIGLGIAKDIRSLNMDIGVGVVRDLDKFFDPKEGSVIKAYIGVHF